MHYIWRLIKAGLKLVLSSTMIAVGSCNGANEGSVVHLLGKLGEDFGNLHAIDRSFDRIKFALNLASGFWIPRVEMAHAAAIPEKDDVLGSRL
jgi:hypothetical protein